MVKCNVVPGWCDAYWMAVRGGPPRVAIVYGDDGIGNPELLRNALADPHYVGINATLMHLNMVQLGNLQDYDLVIVEKARRMSTAKLRIFVDYVNQGGRLVWTGDAGTEADSGDDYLYEDESPDFDSNQHKLIGGWARKQGKEIVAFYQLLSVNYITNYCTLKGCGDNMPWQGILVPEPTRSHPLVEGIKPALEMRGDFAIVNTVSSPYPSKMVMTLDWGSALIGGKDKKDFGKMFPFIVTSGFGEKVAYYAVPPDHFVQEAMKDKYYSFIENLYWGMLR
jgi:hypothetical protein